MKIVIITPEDLAFKLNLRDQILFLINRGFQIHVITNKTKYHSYLVSLNIPFTIFHFTRVISPFRDLFVLLRLTFLLWKLRPDCVHTHAPKGALLGQWSAWLCLIPLRIDTVHGFYFDFKSRRLKDRFFRMVEMGARLPAHRILFQNREDLAFASDGILGSKQLIYLGNGVDEGKFNPNNISTDERETFIKQHFPGYKPGVSKIIGTVGRLVREKGYEDFFDAADILLKQGQDIYILIAASRLESERDPFSIDSLSSDLRQRIAVLYNFEDMPIFYSALDCMVLASYREGMPRCLIEAALMNVPMVGTDIRGIREIISEGETGFMVPKHNPGCIAKKISVIIKDACIRALFIENAHKNMIINYTSKAVCDRLEKVYN
jgi:glycosyltransferase involved in cell wall biosynthesis